MSRSSDKRRVTFWIEQYDNATKEKSVNDLIFLDTETTGLEPDKHEIWEIAWAINDGPVSSAVVEHSIVTANLRALEMNGYFRRRPGAPLRFDVAIREVLKDSTLVCANPTFDRMFMRARWGYEPYHYRSIDIETMAMTVFGWDRPKGLKDIRNHLDSLGYVLVDPDHSAGNDVAATRDVYKILRTIQEERVKGAMK